MSSVLGVGVSAGRKIKIITLPFKCFAEMREKELFCVTATCKRGITKIAGHANPRQMTYVEPFPLSLKTSRNNLERDDKC